MHWGSFTSYSLYFDGAQMTADQTEFLLAIAAYQKRFRRRFPTWLEAMHVLHCLGYRKVAEPEPISEPQPPAPSTSEIEEGEGGEVPECEGGGCERKE